MIKMADYPNRPEKERQNPNFPSDRPEREPSRDPNRPNQPDIEREDRPEKERK
jgi:hypothetical protein